MHRNVEGLDAIIWAGIYVRSMPSTSGLTREEFDRAADDAEREADLHIERRRDRQHMSAAVSGEGPEAVSANARPGSVAPPAHGAGSSARHRRPDHA